MPCFSACNISYGAIIITACYDKSIRLAFLYAISGSLNADFVTCDKSKMKMGLPLDDSLFSDLLEKIKEADHILHAKCRCNQDTCLYAGFCFFDATSSKSCNLLLWIDWFHSSLHPLSTETINTLPSFIILILPSNHDQRNTGSI